MFKPGDRVRFKKYDPDNLVIHDPLPVYTVQTVRESGFDGGVEYVDLDRHTILLSGKTTDSAGWYSTRLELVEPKVDREKAESDFARAARTLRDFGYEVRAEFTPPVKTVEV